MSDENAVVLANQNGDMPMTAVQVRAQVNLIQQVMAGVMQKDVHYGMITGIRSKVPSLFKPGAEKLCATFRIAPRYRIEDLSTSDCVRYRITCEGVHQTTGILLGEGVGECSSLEDKYKWRKSKNVNEFEATPEDRRRVKWENGQNGPYKVDQIRTDPADLANTILKMAAKRAQVAMTLNVTAASDIFTQDIEDLPDELREDIAGDDGGHQQKTEVRPPKAKSEARPAAEARPSSPPPAEGASEALPADAIATEGMRKFVSARMEGGALTEDDLRKKFGFGLADMPAGRVNDVIAWTKDPVGAEA